MNQQKYTLFNCINNLINTHYDNSLYCSLSAESGIFPRSLHLATHKKGKKKECHLTWINLSFRDCPINRTKLLATLYTRLSHAIPYERLNDPSIFEISLPQSKSQVYHEIILHQEQKVFLFEGSSPGHVNG